MATSSSQKDLDKRSVPALGVEVEFHYRPETQTTNHGRYNAEAQIPVMQTYEVQHPSRKAVPRALDLLILGLALRPLSESRIWRDRQREEPKKRKSSESSSHGLGNELLDMMSSLPWDL